MMKRLTLVLLLLVSAMTLAVIPAMAQTADEPVVRAVLFWSDTCPHCHYVIEEVLPPLQEQYGDQLDIVLVELNNQESADRFYAAGAAYGLPQNRMGVPFMIVGEHALMGSSQIPDELPGLIEKYLAEGGVDIPAVKGLEGLAKPIVEDLPQTPVPDPGPTGMSGAIPAFAILLALIGSLIFVAVRLFMAKQQSAWPPRMAWLSWLIPVLAVIGIIVAGYLTYVETQAVEAVCGPFGDCNTVQSSPYAKLFGIPIGIIGLLGYAAILAAWFWGRSGNVMARTALLGMTVVGALFSVYLTYLEIFVIHAVCAWCLGSALIMALLLLAAAAWLATTWEPPARRVRGRPVATR
ncbi:MAG: vitamin K epoxide reductase [Anaerolineae bacterium]|nr:vitamin K epoxide reductase [Anaerolineae bacterium]